VTKLSTIQIQIKDSLEKYKSLNTIKAHVDEINTKLKEAYAKLKILDSNLDKELKDIENIEGGVKSLFYKVLGNKEEQLDKERQEYLEASLKFKEYKKSIELMEYEKGLLEKKLSQLPILHKQIDSLKAQREQEILRSPDLKTREELQQILSKMDLCILLRKELDEAVEEGEKSAKLLSVVLSYLKKARDWGRWDMQGNRRGDYMKNRAIDQAIKSLSQAQYQLDMFSRELEDLGDNNVRFKLNISHFNKFTDFFFDNLISDWIVQQKIKSTINNIESTFDQVQRIILSLNQEKKSTSQKFDQLEAAKTKLLLD
jgi:hypothetical protein